MARTAMTARKSIGGKAPRTQLATRSVAIDQSLSKAVQLPRSGAGIKWHVKNAVPEARNQDPLNWRVENGWPIGPFEHLTNAVPDTASVPISKTKSTRKRVPYTISKPVTRIDDLQTVKSLLPFSPILPRSCTSGFYSSQLTGSKIPWNKKPSSTYTTKHGFLSHEQRKLNYERDGPQQLSDPLSTDQVTKLKVCITSAFKHPTRFDLWADPYFPGMAALLKWFSLFFDLKQERCMHLDVLKSLAQTESVKRDIEELQSLETINPKRGKGLFGQPTPQDFQFAVDELMNEIEFHEKSKKKLELQRILLRERLEAEKTGSKVETRMNLEQKNSDLTKIYQNLLLKLSNGPSFYPSTQVSQASDKMEKCEAATQTAEEETTVEIDEVATFDSERNSN